jgi:hypothetical protein
MEGWELGRLLRASRRISIDAQKAILTQWRREIEAHLERLAADIKDVNAQETEAWRQRTGGFGLRVIK